MTLIPFAWSKKTRSLVDISDVPSGKICACHCPSCDSPLIKQNRSIFVPAYWVDEPLSGERVKVTEARTIEYQSCIIDVEGVDALLFFGEHRLGIFISYRSGRIYNGAGLNHLTGVIEIDLSGFRIIRSQINTIPCKEQLLSLLNGEDGCKAWRWHCRQMKLIERVKCQFLDFQSRTEQQLVQQKRQNVKYITKRSVQCNDVAAANRSPITNTDKLNRDIWRCSKCHLDYPNKHSLKRCPSCHSDLYSYPLK